MNEKTSEIINDEVKYIIHLQRTIYPHRPNYQGGDLIYNNFYSAERPSS